MRAFPNSKPFYIRYFGNEFWKRFEKCMRVRKRGILRKCSRKQPLVVVSLLHFLLHQITFCYFQFLFWKPWKLIFLLHMKLSKQAWNIQESVEYNIVFSTPLRSICNYRYFTFFDVFNMFESRGG